MSLPRAAVFRSSPLLVALALAAPACGGDSRGTADTLDTTAVSDADATADDDTATAPDATTADTADAADGTAVGPADIVFDTAVEDTHAPDTVAPDDTADPADVAPPEPVLVTVYDSAGTPLVGIPVIAHDAGGNPILERITGDLGQVELEVAGVAMVTAIVATDEATQLTTVLGVTPGQHVAFGSPPRPPTGETPRSVTMEAHLPAAYPDATKYLIATGCGTHVSSGYIDTLIRPESEICFTGAQRIDLFAAAMAADNTALAFAVVPDFPVPDSGSMSITPDGWRTDWHSIAATLDHLPADFDTVGYELSGRVAGHVYQLPWGRGQTGALPDAPSLDTLPIALAVPPDFFTGLGVTIQLVSLTDTLYTEQDLAWEGDGVPDDLAIDVEAERLPHLSAVTAQWVGDEALRLDWTSDRPFEGVTAIVADVFFDGGSKGGRWTVEGPTPTEAGLETPRLPSAYAGLLPGASSTAPLAGMQVIDIDGATFADYQAACGTVSDFCTRVKAATGSWSRRLTAGSPEL